MPNPFVHIELTTDNLGSAKQFYQSIFDWKLNEMPAMAYTGIDVGKGGTGGGMQAKPMPNAPTGWLPYVQVDDVKVTVAKAVAAGGRCVLDYMPIGEMGAIAIFSDPNGSSIGVWETSEKNKRAAKKVAAKPAKKAVKAAKKKPAKKVAKKKSATKKSATKK